MDRAARAVAQWRRERPDLEVRPMLVLGRLSEAAGLIGQGRMAPVFARFGLQRGEFDVLATLRRTGKPFALTPTALYEATMISSGAMTNRLDRLEEAGLIRRARRPGDRRGVLVSLTDKGFELIEAAIEAHVANQQAILSGLTRKEQEALAGLLEKLLATLTDENG